MRSGDVREVGLVGRDTLGQLGVTLLQVSAVVVDRNEGERDLKKAGV